MKARICAGMLLWLGLPLLGAERSELTPVPALAPAALPAGYREALQQLDADSLSALDIDDQLTGLSALQTPACRDELHRAIARARHPSRFLPLLKAFPGATSFRIVLPYYQARPEDFGELLKSILSPDCSEAIEEQALASDKDFLTLLDTDEVTLARCLAAHATAHPEAGPLWRLPELRRVYAEAAKTSDVAPLFLPEFPPALHRTLQKELKLDPQSPVGLASLARCLGADWSQFHRGGKIWSTWGDGKRKQALDALKVCLNQSAMPAYDWSVVCARIFHAMPSSERSAWIDIAASYDLFELLGPAPLAGLLLSDDKKLLQTTYDDNATWPKWLSQAVLAQQPPDLDLLSASEAAQIDEMDWEKLPKAELKQRLQSLRPELRHRLAMRQVFPQLQAADMIDIFGLNVASHCSLYEVEKFHLEQLLTLPRFDLKSANLNFKPSAAAAIEEMLLTRSQPFYSRQNLFNALDQSEVPSIPSILRRLHAGFSVIPLPEEAVPTLLKHLETQPIDLDSLRLAQNLWDLENAPTLPAAFLDKLVKSVDALELTSLPFALHLLNLYRPDSPQIRTISRRLIEAHRLDLYDASLFITWGLHLEGLKMEASDRADLELQRRISPDFVSQEILTALLPASDPELSEEALTLCPSQDLLVACHPLSSARQDELRKEIGLCYNPAKLWQRARLASSLRGDSEAEAKEIFDLLKGYPEQLALLQKRPDWPQIRQTCAQYIHPDDLKQAQALSQLGCLFPQAVWVDLLRRVQNEAELLLLLRFASTQPPLAPDLEAALIEALEHSRNHDFFFLHKRQKESAAFAWPDPAADAQEKRVWELKCRLQKKSQYSPFCPLLETPAEYDLSRLVSRWQEAPIEIFPALHVELFRCCSKLVATRILVRVIGETDDPRRLRALLKLLPAELKSDCAWSEYDYSYEVRLDLRALSFWVASGIIPEAEVPTWLRPHLNGLIFREKANEYGADQLKRENGPRRLPEWSIAGDRIVFSPAAPAGYQAGSLENLWPFLGEELRQSWIAQIKDEALKLKLQALPLRPAPPALGTQKDEPEEAKAPLLPPRSISIPYTGKGFGAAAMYLTADTLPGWDLALKGDFAAAAKLAAASAKNLQRCYLYRALADSADDTRHSAEERQRLTTARYGLLQALLAADSVDLTIAASRQEVFHWTGLAHIDRLAPHLAAEDLRWIPQDQLLTCLRHPQFPKALLASDELARLVWTQIHDVKKDSPTELNNYLALGVSPVALLRAARGSSSGILPHLIRKGCLPMQEPLVRQQVFNHLFASDDEELWQQAGKQGLRWISPKKQSFDEECRYIYPYSLTAWLRLSRFTGLDLGEEEYLDRIFEESITPAERDSARVFLQKQSTAVRRLDKNGRNRLFTCHSSWLGFLLDFKLDPHQRDTEGKTALFARYPAEDIRLLLAAGADAKALDHQGRSALYGENAESVKLLLAAGADARIIDKEGGNALFVYHDSMATPLLLAAGADGKQVDKAGRNPLFIINGSSIQNIPLLVAAGANPKAFDKDGNGVLFGLKEDYVIAALIEGGAEINQRSPDGRKTIWNQWNSITAPLPPPDPSHEDQISVAAIDGQPREKEPLLPWMEAILKNGAEPALADAEARTPLMLFARAGRPLLLRRLLAEGAKARPDALDKHGRNALDAVFLDTQPMSTEFAGSAPRRLLCARLLQKQGMKLSLDAASPGLDRELWQQWQRLQAGTASDAEITTILDDLLRYRDPDFSRAFLVPRPAALDACIAACAWPLARDLIFDHPELIQPGGAATQRILAELEKCRKATYTGGGCRRSGYHQDDFDAFETKVKTLAEERKP